eukprot:758444-Hanusia_phi.AAC.5
MVARRRMIWIISARRRYCIASHMRYKHCGTAFQGTGQRASLNSLSAHLRRCESNEVNRSEMNGIVIL